MSWVTLTTGDFIQATAAPELSALRTAATEKGQPDPAIEVAENIVREIRGYCAGCPRNRLGPAGTIPAELKAAALDMFRWRLTLRLPGVKFLQDDARRAAYNDALALLAKVASCSFAIEQPDEPAAVDTGGSAIPKTGNPRTQFQPDNFRGAGP
jgi:hypothetical protein